MIRRGGETNEDHERNRNAAMDEALRVFSLCGGLRRGLMYRDAYGDPNYYIVRNGERIYCGWNIHHILPLARGGTDSSDNLICTNIITNELAADKIASICSL